MKELRNISAWILFFVGICLVPMVFSSCRGEEDEVETNAIDFSASNDVLESKSELINNLTYVGNTIRVFGDFNNNDGRVHQVFQDTKVSYNASGQWTYSPIEYWMNNGTYDFRAVWPPKADVLAASSGKQIHVQNYSVVSDDAYDLMVAYVFRDMNISNDKSPVDLLFRHALAAVNVMVRKEADDPQAYTLKETYFKNMWVAGNLVFSGNPTTPEALSDCWNRTYFQQTKCLNHTYNADITSAGTTPFNQFIMPQDVNASPADENKTTLGYTLVINGTEVTTEVVLPAIEWLPGKIYTYRINLKSSGADIEVITTEWDKVEVTAEDIIGELN